MQNYRAFLSLGMATLLSLTTACQREFDISRLPIPIQLTSQAKEQLMLDFSRGFAKALQQEPALRAFVKAEAIKQIDGDYDVLYILSKDDKVDDKRTMHELLSAYLPEGQTLNDIECDFLNLNIKVLGFNGKVEDWNTENFVPTVAIRSYNEKSAAFAAYNGQGDKLTLDAHITPEQLTIVVEESERIKINSYETLAQGFNKSFSKYISYNIEDGNSAAAPIKQALKQHQTNDGRRGDDGAMDPDWWKGTCPRKSPEAATQDKSKLESINITKSAFEKASDNWAEGRLDITAKLLTVRGDAKALDQLDLPTEVYKEYTETVYVTVRPGSRGGGYRTFTHYGYDEDKPHGGGMPNWDITLNGNTWKISFLETDPGGTTVKTTKSFTSTFEAGIKTTDASKSIVGFNANYRGSEEGKVEISYTDVDDPMGDQFIYYCDRLGASTDYFTGDVHFIITPRQ